MINYEELEHFIAFADFGTLSKAAEHLHISQPTITRSMQNIENAFGVSLFIRSKNRIELNSVGEEAVKYARNLLDNTSQMITHIRTYDRSLRTILIKSCAPAPLWSLVQNLSAKFPNMAVTSELDGMNDIIGAVKNGACQVGVLPYAIEDELLFCKKYVTENLSVCLPSDHPAVSNGRTELTFHDINGFNCLLKSEIGFWEDLCHIKMPASKFLVQTDIFEFLELANHSTLPFFTTNLSNVTEEHIKNRVEIPITDIEANVTYHIISRKDAKIQI